MADLAPEPEVHADPVSRNFEKVVQGFRLILEGLGVPETVHSKDTAERAATAWWEELCSGLTHTPPYTSTFTSSVDQMIVVRGIPVRSLCVHHLLPFLGHATIAYIPGRGHILGVSKLSRLTDYWSRRPQVQEELTEQIADAVAALVVGERGGVGVMIQANHLCMEMRGVQHVGNMITSALRGALRTDPAARAEFLKYIPIGVP